MLRVICLLAVVVCAYGAVDRTASIIPANGTLIGASVDYGLYGGNISKYEAQLTRSPAAFVLFFSFPLLDSEVQQANPIIVQIGARKRIAIVTLEPWAGLLNAQDPAALAKLSDQVKAWEDMGATVIVRFAHEMNGSWYPWGQQPTAYRQTFALVAAAVTSKALNSTMLWAPNEGGGYPYAGGKYQLKCNATEFNNVTGWPASSSECAQLDTNKDGVINMADDPYTPYYPGDDVADWVGLSVYHFGGTYPFGANVVPENNKFYNKIAGNYSGVVGNETALPSFYDLFCTGTRSKPMIIGETAALYNLCDKVKNGRGCTGKPGASELSIKTAWWKQVFAVADSAVGPAIPRVFPQIKLINWFDISKTEAEAQNNTVDWTISRTATIRNAFLMQVNQTYANQTYWQLPLNSTVVTPAAAVAVAAASAAVVTPTAAVAAASAAGGLPTSAAAVPRICFSWNKYTILIQPESC